jgi:hypothetical protein
MPTINPLSGSPLSGTAPTASSLPARSGGEAFTVPTANAAPATAGVAASAPLAMLASQEIDDPHLRARTARRQAGAILDTLSRLQASLLGTEEDTAATARLAALATLPTPDDPALATLTRAIATRAAVELARRDEIKKS